MLEARPQRADIFGKGGQNDCNLLYYFREGKMAENLLFITATHVFFLISGRRANARLPNPGCGRGWKDAESRRAIQALWMLIMSSRPRNGGESLRQSRVAVVMTTGKVASKTRGASITATASSTTSDIEWAFAASEQ